MKKLSLIFAMVLSIGFTFAQNNVGTILETGDGNTGYVQQDGMNNLATITQVGDNNRADLADQYASTLFPLLTGTKGITQDGENNTGAISQINGVFGTQSGYGPIAGIGQYGHSNTATITQSHSNVFMQEYAWVRQDGNHNTSLQNQLNTNAISHVLQQGNVNEAETQQIGGYNQNANVWQHGDGNYAYQEQGLQFHYTQNNLAEITQLGADNDAMQRQLGSGNTAKTIQEGNRNLADLLQQGNDNYADIYQHGDDNEVRSHGPATQLGDLHELYVDQVGNNNLGWVFQSGLNHTGTINQLGNNNIATVWQEN